MRWHTRMKPDFVFRRKGRVHLNRRRTSVQSTTDSRGVRISGSSAGYTVFQGSAKGTGYPLHSSVPLHFPSLASPCAITFQLDTTTHVPRYCHASAVRTLRCIGTMFGQLISANRFDLRPPVKGETYTFCAIYNAQNDDWLNGFVPKVCFRIPRDPQPVPRGSVDSFL